MALAKSLLYHHEQRAVIMPKELEVENLKNRKLYDIPVDQLEPDPDQPRKYFDEDSLQRLAKSIKTDKVLQPILFSKQSESGQLTIISGERRWRASKLVGLETIPGIYIARPSEFMALAENMVREELTPIERSEAIKRIIDDGKYTHEIVAARLGKSRSSITNILSLAKLPDDIKDECRNSKEYPLRELLKVASKKTPKGMATAFKKLKAKSNTEHEVGKQRKKKASQLTSSQKSKLVSKYSISLKELLDDHDDIIEADTVDHMVMLRDSLVKRLASLTDR